MMVVDRPEAQALRARVCDALRTLPEAPEIDFCVSALTDHNPRNSTDEVRAWLSSQNETRVFEVKEIPLDALRQWRTHPETGDIVHESGKFFMIRGLEVETNVGATSRWSQPIIDQPEIGVLGFIAQRRDGILYLLAQAKAEPGNINTYQLSPTVQATRSNFSRVHGGKKTLFLEYFLGHPRVKVLVDQLQSEQGARFFRKRNRNMIVQVPDDETLDVPSNFRWLTIGQLTDLIHVDNTVNMDSRSVLSCISIDPPVKTSVRPVDVEGLDDFLALSPIVGRRLSAAGRGLLLSAHGNTTPFQPIDDIVRRITEAKFRTELKTRLIPLRQIQRWTRNATAIRHDSGQYFEVIGVRIRANSREVHEWDQPIVRQVHRGLVGFVMKDIGGVPHFLVQLKLECGNLDLLELASTVQCLTSSYEPDDMPPYVTDVLGESGHTTVLSSTFQSEEGGRFFRESNQNVIAIAKPSFATEVGDQFLWMTLAQMKGFLKFNNFLNIQARSLLANLRFR